MEFKGTQGEWYIIASEPVEIATDATSIGFVNIQDYQNKDLEAQANAKLIAAAPDLLKALDDLLEVDSSNAYAVFTAERNGLNAIHKALN